MCDDFAHEVLEVVAEDALSCTECLQPLDVLLCPDAVLDAVQHAREFRAGFLRIEALERRHSTRRAVGAHEPDARREVVARVVEAARAKRRAARPARR